jgi:hypothetical protein
MQSTEIRFRRLNLVQILLVFQSELIVVEEFDQLDDFFHLSVHHGEVHLIELNFHLVLRNLIAYSLAGKILCHSCNRVHAENLSRCFQLILSSWKNASLLVR